MDLFDENLAFGKVAEDFLVALLRNEPFNLKTEPDWILWHDASQQHYAIER